MNPVSDAAIADLLAAVAGRLLASGQRLVTAESCTGGWIAKACTDLPGSSRWSRGGVVAYDNDLNVRLPGVDPRSLDASGAGSEAERLKRAFHITGDAPFDWNPIDASARFSPAST